MNYNYDNDIIFETLDLLDYLSDKYNNIIVRNEDRYGSIVAGLGEEQEEDERVRSWLAKYGLGDAGFRKIMKSINWKQHPSYPFLLLKYGKSIVNVGWHPLALVCRGKVVDYENRKIIAYPFDKFFNLGEIEDNSEDKIREELAEADYVSVTEKKDGSLIIVTKVVREGTAKLLLHSQGDWDSEQAKLAAPLIDEVNIKEGYTYMFELIHPQNKIVVDYGNEKELYLLGVRDLKDYRLLKYEEFKDWGFKVTPQIRVKKGTLDIPVYSGGEGYVFRIGDDRFFKMKYKEYFELARVKNCNVSMKNVYKWIREDRLDEAIMFSGEKEEEIKKITTEIYCWVDRFNKYIDWKINEFKGEELKKVAKELKEENNVFMVYIMRGLREGNRKWEIEKNSWEDFEKGVVYEGEV